MKDTLLPASIFALALAVAFHGLPSAVAQEAPEAELAPAPVRCTPVVVKGMDPQKMAANLKPQMDAHAGRDEVVVLPLASGTFVCSW